MKSQVRLPDMSVGNIRWPTSAAGTWSVMANEPCANTDFYVSPETARYITPRGVTSEYSTPGNSLIEGSSVERPFTTAPL